MLLIRHLIPSAYIKQIRRQMTFIEGASTLQTHADFPLHLGPFSLLFKDVALLPNVEL